MGAAEVMSGVDVTGGFEMAWGAGEGVDALASASGVLVAMPESSASARGGLGFFVVTAGAAVFAAVPVSQG